MDSLRSSRVILFLLLQVVCGEYSIPEVNIEVLSPKGLRASIPDYPSLNLFAFHANINKDLGPTEVGKLAGEILSATNGRWIFEDKDVEIKLGAIIRYRVFVSVDGTGYDSKVLNFKVKEKNTNVVCIPSVTRTTLNSNICSGQVIFEEHFNNSLEYTWQIEQKLPTDHPEFPFVSYQRRRNDHETVIVENGMLKITSFLQTNMPGFDDDSLYSGQLNLIEGCTESADNCFISPLGPNIIPPVVSGRLSLKSFPFMYGFIEIRAKLPQGDWLYPEILLEPYVSKYGKYNFASGVIKIASARGNNELYSESQHYGNNILYGGPIMDFKCHSRLLKTNKKRSGKWGSDFHTYALRWEPERLIFLVDNEEWSRVEATSGSLGDKFNNHDCPDLPRNILASGKKLAPFDEYFFLTLGLAAGGITDFKDGTYTTGGRPKPWTNLSSKSKLNFWKDQAAWYSTWKRDSQLKVDSVKITAI